MDKYLHFLKKIKTTYFTKNFFLFIFCGGIGTLTNFVFSLIFSMKINSTISYVLGYSISLFVSYSLNSFIIYKEKLNLLRFIKFIISYLPNFIILFSLVFILLNILNWNKIIVYLLAGLFGLPVTYVFVKIYAFSKKN